MDLQINQACFVDTGNGMKWWSLELSFTLIQKGENTCEKENNSP